MSVTAIATTTWKRLLLLAGAPILIVGAAAASCSDDSGTAQPPPVAAGPTVNGLTPAQSAEVLVKIGNQTITVGEFAKQLADQSPYLRARYNSPERRREFLDNMVRFELLASEAARQGLTKLPEVERARKRAMIEQMMKREFDERIRPSDVPAADIRTYYEGHRSEFNKAEQVRASHILIADRAAAQRVLAQIREHPTDVNLFRDLAGQHNEDTETRDRFGDLRFFSRPADRQPDEPVVPDTVALAAFAITQVGGVHAGLVQSPAGYHIVKLTSRRAALARTLEESERTIRDRLWRERRERAVDDLLARLRRDATVREDWSLLSQVRLAPAPTTPPPTAQVPANPPPPAITPPPAGATPPAAPVRQVPRPNPAAPVAPPNPGQP